MKRRRQRMRRSGGIISKDAVCEPPSMKIWMNARIPGSRDGCSEHGFEKGLF